MFLPIGDDNRDRHITPIINYGLIAVNILVFVFLQGMSANNIFTFTYSTVPAEILTGTDISGTFGFENPIDGTIEKVTYGKSDWPVYGTLLTSMFMHGGWAHLLGNMLYLWICGDNIENDMGHLKYLAFYLLCGIIAGLSHVFSTHYLGHNPYVPSLGASGAISGVLGGYLMMHPKRRMHVWVFLGVISVPAVIVVGLWFVFQIINGMGALGGQEGGGIAYAAHIGGFIAGFILVRLFANRKRPLIEERKSAW
jgi:membrane associated rhomboid family serine protease